MKFTHVCFKVLSAPWVERQSFVFAEINAAINAARAENQLVKQIMFPRWRGKKSNPPS